MIDGCIKFWSRYWSSTFLSKFWMQTIQTAKRHCVMDFSFLDKCAWLFSVA